MAFSFGWAWLKEARNGDYVPNETMHACTLPAGLARAGARRGEAPAVVLTMYIERNREEEARFLN